MASNDFANGKIHGASEAKAKFGHTTKDERKRRSHSNKNIDKSMTDLNTSIHQMLTGHEYTYREICDAYDARIAELDAVPGQSKRKDRVTLQAIETPAPADLPAKQQDAWFLRVAQIQMAMYGEENYLDGHIDRDEQHEYMDPATKQMVTSRVHMVSYLFPVVPDKDGAPKLNCKKFSRRANINRLNKAVEEMSVAEFGVHFMTGAKTKSNKTVEQLKQESSIAEMEAKIEQAEHDARVAGEAESARWAERIAGQREESADIERKTDDLIELQQRFVGEDTFVHDGETVIGLGGAITMRDEALAAAAVAEREADTAIEDAWPAIADARLTVDEAAFEAEIVAHAAEVDADRMRKRVKRETDAAKADLAEGARRLEMRRHKLEQEFDERARSLDDYADRLADIESDGFLDFAKDVLSGKDGVDAIFHAKGADGRSVDDGIAAAEPDARRRGPLRTFAANIVRLAFSTMSYLWNRHKEDAAKEAKQQYRDAAEEARGRYIERETGGWEPHRGERGLE